MVVTKNGLLSYYRLRTWLNRTLRKSISLSASITGGRLTFDVNAQKFFRSYRSSQSTYIDLFWFLFPIAATHGQCFSMLVCSHTIFRLMTYIDVQCDRAHRVHWLHNTNVVCNGENCELRNKNSACSATAVVRYARNLRWQSTDNGTQS